MFDLTMSDEYTAIQEVIASVAGGLVDSAAREAEVGANVSDAVWEGLLQLGFTTSVAEEFGGGGLPDALGRLMAIEGLASGDPGITAAAVFSGQAATLIGLCGTNEQRTAHLPSLATDARRRTACALYEGFGRAPSESHTTICAHGDRWRVIGHKVGVGFAAAADLIIVSGTDPADGRLRAALLTSDQVTASVGSGIMALHAAQLGSIDFDVVVESADLLGGPDADPDTLARALSQLRLAVAAMGLGCARRACEYAAEYAGGRVAFGKPIAAFQGVSFMMADARMQLDASRLEVWHVATHLETEQTPALERAVTQAVNYAGHVATNATRDAVQVLGGHGFIEDHPVERWYRAAAVLSSLDFDPTVTPYAAAL
jgi:alkylation response protein AidB-like acyl-CoA dehydrogenase